MADGTVSLSLDSYEAMQDEIRALRFKCDELKTKYEEEKAKTWKIFGPVFEGKRRVSFYDSPSTFESAIVVEMKDPRTFIKFHNYDHMEVPEKIALTRQLIDNHIADVIKNIDFTGLEQWLQEKKKK